MPPSLSLLSACFKASRWPFAFLVTLKPSSPPELPCQCAQSVLSRHLHDTPLVAPLLTSLRSPTTLLPPLRPSIFRSPLFAPASRLSSLFGSLSPHFTLIPLKLISAVSTALTNWSPLRGRDISVSLSNLLFSVALSSHTYSKADSFVQITDSVSYVQYQ